MTTTDVVGPTEIDARLGLGNGTTRQWIRRHGPGIRSRTPFPRPHWTVSGEDGYDWAEVRQWLFDTGRLVRTTARDEQGADRITETARSDEPAELGEQIRAALAGVPRSRWLLDYEDGRWELWLPDAAPQAEHHAAHRESHPYGNPDVYAASRWGGDLRLALRMDELLRQAGLGLALADPATRLANGERVEVIC